VFGPRTHIACYREPQGDSEKDLVAQHTMKAVVFLGTETLPFCLLSYTVLTQFTCSSATLQQALAFCRSLAVFRN
jgi:hypothetical protein